MNERFNVTLDTVSVIPETMMFYRSDDLTNSVKKSWRSVVSHPDRPLPSGHQKTQILTLY